MGISEENPEQKLKRLKRQCAKLTTEANALSRRTDHDKSYLKTIDRRIFRLKRRIISLETEISSASRAEASRDKEDVPASLPKAPEKIPPQPKEGGDGSSGKGSRDDFSVGDQYQGDGNFDVKQKAEHESLAA